MMRNRRLLRDVMKRVIGTALLLWLLAAVIAPLYAAMNACTMPCCNHAAPMPCCKVTTSHPSDVATVVVPATPNAVAVDDVAGVVAPSVIIRISFVPDRHRSIDRPLHLLHSVFLI
jgi:hypothetical protein